MKCEVKKTPIMEFKTLEEADECLKEWQSRLFLNDWIIHLSLVPRQECTIDGIERAGINHSIREGMCAVIKLPILDEDLSSRIVKLSHEVVLVHELLHCKYNWIESDYNSIPNAYYDISEHMLIEQMAKSLIMAKYDIDLSWFKNW